MKLTQIIIICVSVFLIAVQTQEIQVNGKIPDAIPYHCIVKIGERTDMNYAGSIISRRHVITVAHIIEQSRPLSDYLVGVGSNRKDQLLYYEVQQIDIHPNYVSPFIYSMSVILLKYFLTFNSFIQPVALPPFGIHSSLLNVQGQIASFDRGDTGVESTILKVAYQHIVNETGDPTNSIIYGDLSYNRYEYCITKQLGAGFVVKIFGVDTIMAINQLDIPCIYTNLSPYTSIMAGREWIFGQFGL